MHFLSQAQAKEVRELFAFLDTDRDGLLDVGQGINLCRQLGFNVDASTLQHAETHVSVKDLLGWCEVFVAKCAHSEDLHLTQMYQLLSQRHIGGGDGITSRGLRRFLADEKLSFPPEQAPSPTHLKALVEQLLEYMSDDARRQVSCADFKSWLRGGIHQFGAGVDSDDDEPEPAREVPTWSAALDDESRSRPSKT